MKKDTLDFIRDVFPRLKQRDSVVLVFLGHGYMDTADLGALMGKPMLGFSPLARLAHSIPYLKVTGSINLLLVLRSLIIVCCCPVRLQHQIDDGMEDEVGEW